MAIKKKSGWVYVLLDMPRNGGEEKESSNCRDYYKYQNIKDDLIHFATLTWMAFVVLRQTYHPAQAGKYSVNQFKLGPT